MKAIKIIDLLIKINNFNNGKSESLPNKIKWNTRYYYLKEDAIDGHFYYDNSYCKTFIAEIDNFTQLNDEVEIIEEDKEIGKIPNDYYHENQDVINQQFKIKINELIDKVNSLEDKKC